MPFMVTWLFRRTFTLLAKWYYLLLVSFIIFLQPCNARWILCCRTFTARCHWSLVNVFSTLKYLFCHCFRILTVVSKQRICLIANKTEKLGCLWRETIYQRRSFVSKQSILIHICSPACFCFVLSIDVLLLFVIIFKPKKALYTSMESRLLFINFHFTVL